MSKSFILKTKIFLVFSLILFLNGCSSIPYDQRLETTIQNPKNIYSSIPNDVNVQEKNNYSLFEDYKAHNIGDTMTVVLQENVSASNSSSSNITRNGNSNIGVTAFPNPFNLIGNNHKNQAEFNTVGKHDYSGKGSSTAKNIFTGIITVTVSNILPNRNMQVYGEKTITINKGTEKIIFSGIVNPQTIGSNNSVISTQVADAHIEYISNNYVNNTNHMGWLQRLFFKISPM
ncbi:Flagellar L-ring protein [Buchnera aphidicola (Eriosoma grossulariae)]|uniref:flagellar basal body L-ring protein FlgH n=1 Tax=Buchnera aphidicola TaxID=9 RepID=UPI00346424A2